MNFPTRITQTSTSLIDNIFIDKNINYSISPYINGLSDHDAQLLILPDVTQIKIPPRYILRRSFDEVNAANFRWTLSHETWEEIFTESDVNEMFNKFLNIYLRCFNHGFPIQKKIIHKKIKINGLLKVLLYHVKRKKSFICYIGLQIT